LSLDNPKITSLIPRLGGKRLLAEQIVGKMPLHELYVEVFCGGASVFFRKEPALYEVINDIDGDLICFFQVVKEKPVQFLQELYLSLVSRETFERYTEELKNTELTDVQRAVRVYYVYKNSFAGMGRTFGVSATSKPKLNFVDVDHLILTAYQRLRRVTIENLDWEKCIKTYDRAHTFFYLDPPYRTKTSREYPSWLTDKDYTRLAEILKGIMGKFLLSINKDEFIIDLFQGFKIEEIETTYSVNKNTSQRVIELLISN
jgi:DNA adenine methylase